MRHQALIGYVLHHKAYQEKRALYHLFTPTHGVVHGVGKKGMPLLTRMALFATGKGGLKTFSQPQPQHNRTNLGQITGQNLYGALYVNELLWRLLTVEDPMPMLWWAYEQTLMLLANACQNSHNSQNSQNSQNSHTLLPLAYILRCFESLLFAELGYGISFVIDEKDNAILPTQHYCYHVNKGWVRLTKFEASSSGSCQRAWLGADVLKLAMVNEKLAYFRLCHVDDFGRDDVGGHDVGGRDVGCDDVPSHAMIDAQFVEMLHAWFALVQPVMPAWTQLHRQVVDSLLDDKPLQSRKLWQQQRRFLSP